MKRNETLIRDRLSQVYYLEKLATIGHRAFCTEYLMLYPEFSANLQKKGPDLELADAEICAYIRMGFASKEIAEIKNTSPGAISTRRTRIRKKLSVNVSGQSLSAFLLYL